MHRGLLCLTLLVPLACGDDLKGETGASDGESTDNATTHTPTTGQSSVGTGNTTDGTGSGGETTGAPTTGSPTTTTNGTTTGNTTNNTTGEPGEFLRCHDDPPQGATLAPAIPPYAGECPVLELGYADGQPYNTVHVDGRDRLFLVIAPESIGPDETLPVIFLWHWLGGDAKGFYDRGDVQNAANMKRFIAVIPEAREDLLFKWPYSAIDSDADLQGEFQFFDAMLQCVNEQLPVNKECVASTGVSAGALFTSQLAGGRGDVLSSFMSLSGGTGGGTIKPWTQPNHIMPAMVLWGGPNDTCIVINFQQTSQDMEMHLQQNGHFILECVHNCNHSAPPFPVPPGETTFAPLWDFVLDHPYWLGPGESPYNDYGVPELFPDWCAIGAGNAVAPPEPCDMNECSP